MDTDRGDGRERLEVGTGDMGGGEGTEARTCSCVWRKGERLEIG